MIKFHSYGIQDRYKANKVAKKIPNTQVHGINYFETFQHVPWFNFVNLLSVAINKEWSLFQMNARITFLHGILSKAIYIEKLPEYLA